MSRRPDPIRTSFGPLCDKTLKNALAHRIVKEFPRIGGPRICQLCAEMILEVVSKHVRFKDHLVHGQVLWMAVGVDSPPVRHQRIADTELIPVLLEVSTAEDVHSRIDRLPAGQRLLRKAIRLCEQAHQQGGLLSNCDIAELLSTDSSRIGKLLCEHERTTTTIVPRRANLHDVGRGVTHKRIICWKRYVEGKEPHLVARETYHSLEAVDHYLSQYDRVRHCRLEGLTPEQTAHAMGCGVPQVHEYLEIDDLVEKGDA